MLSINQVKYIRSLKQKKFRTQYDNFIIEGEKIALETIQSDVLQIESIIATDHWIESNLIALQKFNDKVIVASEKDLKKISNLKTPNQVFIIAKQISFKLQTKDLKNGLSLFLENIQDPGNLGTILRIADWFGLNRVLLSPQCVDQYNPKVIQSSMGAFLRVKSGAIEFDDLYTMLDDLPIYGTLLDGENIFESKLEKSAVIVIGNESKGISNDLKEKLTHSISIPKRGGAESLNAAVAAGIVCAQFANV